MKTVLKWRPMLLLKVYIKFPDDCVQILQKSSDLACFIVHKVPPISQEQRGIKQIIVDVKVLLHCHTPINMKNLRKYSHPQLRFVYHEDKIRYPSIFDLDFYM